MDLGHDVELTVFDKEGKAVPAHQFFPPKEKALTRGKGPYGEYGLGGKVFRDGTNVELNLNEPWACIGNLLNTTKELIKAAQRRLPAGHTIEARSSYEVELGEDVPPDVTQIGCSPAKNAYGGWEDVAAWMPGTSRIRCAGGHMHFSRISGTYKGDTDMMGNEEWCLENLPKMVKVLDALVAVPLLSLGMEGEAGKVRRRFYGKAGEYRWQHYRPAWAGAPPAYGLEYRVLGPEWIRHVSTASLAFMTARAALSRWQTIEAKLPAGLISDAQQAINQGECDLLFDTPAYQAFFTETVGKWSGWLQAPIYQFTRKKVKELSPSALRTLGEYTQDCHYAWPEYAVKWGWNKDENVGAMKGKKIVIPNVSMGLPE